MPTPDLRPIVKINSITPNITNWSGNDFDFLVNVTIQDNPAGNSDFTKQHYASGKSYLNIYMFEDKGQGYDINNYIGQFCVEPAQYSETTGWNTALATQNAGGIFKYDFSISVKNKDIFKSIYVDETFINFNDLLPPSYVDPIGPGWITEAVFTQKELAGGSDITSPTLKVLKGGSINSGLSNRNVPFYNDKKQWLIDSTTPVSGNSFTTNPAYIAALATYNTKLAAVTTTKAALDSATTALTTAQTNLATAEKNASSAGPQQAGMWANKVNLLKKAVDSAKTAKTTAQTNYDTAVAELATATTNLNNAKNASTNTATYQLSQPQVYIKKELIEGTNYYFIAELQYNVFQYSSIVKYKLSDAFFGTTPTKTPLVVIKNSYQPIVFNGKQPSGTKVPIIEDDPASTGKYRVKLSGGYYFNTSKLDILDEQVRIVGFYFRKSGSSWSENSAIEINSTQTANVPNGQSESIKFDGNYISGLLPATTYQFLTFVLDWNADYRYFSSLSGSVLSNLDPNVLSSSDLDIVSFTTSGSTLSGWQDPSNGSKWYQLYNDWELVTTKNAGDPNLTLVPYFRVRQEIFNIDNPLHHKNLDYTDIKNNITKKIKYPLFYYFNKVFTKDKNYQFKTSMQNYYSLIDLNGVDNNNSKSDFSMRTPWGEDYNFSVPYFSLTRSTTTYPEYLKTTDRKLKFINLYLYTNINSFDSTSEITKPKPIDKIVSKNNPQNPILFSANSYFTDSTPDTTKTTNPGIMDLNVYEFDWDIQGYASFDIIELVNGVYEQLVPYNHPTQGNISGKGWHFIEKKGKFVWFDKYNNQDSLENNENLPFGGNVNDYYSKKTSNRKYLVNNFIMKNISFQSFNVSFDYENSGNYFLSMYLGTKLPSFENDKYNLANLISDGYVKKVNTFKNYTGVQNCEFVGLEGNQFLFFIADPVYKHTDPAGNFITTITTYESTWNNATLTNTVDSVISLSNFKISGAYNDKNNDNFIISKQNDYKTVDPILNATYSINLGSGNNVIPGTVNNIRTINSLAGNGQFNSGIWENGVWNNGWREDLTRKDFYKIDKFFSYEKDKKWKVQISGKEDSVQVFEIGDKVSISNIVAIDINEERKLLKKYYTIINKGIDYIEVEFENDFPLRRIEIDSNEHRICVSKNVWLSGVFLNGYFKGVWNSGLFSGFPLITKMDDSHWIDGIFNGGHFTAKKYGTTFSGVFAEDIDGVQRLGLSFSTPHNLAVNDIISVNPNNTNLLPSIIIGTTIVSKVINDFRVATGVSWKTDYRNVKYGDLYSIISTGLIQNFDFYSNNLSKITSLQSLQSERVFSYNSWIDVNYSNQSSVNIGKPQSILEGDSKRSYSENNLYGYPTNDVLSSSSVFRDSFSTSIRKYNLGKKWKIFNDYVGDSSSFEEYFDSSDTQGGLEAFNTQGWDILVNSETNIELGVSLVDYQEVTQFGKINSMTMSFNNDITYILPEIVKIEGIMNDKTSSQSINTNFQSKYISSATVSNVYYDSTTNKTDVSLLTEIPVFERTSFTKTKYLNKFIKSYLSFKRDNGLTFSRTPEPLNSNSPTIGKELKVTSTNRGGYLNLIPAYDVLNRTNGTDTQTLEKSRYTMVEFDIVDYITQSNSYIDPITGFSQPSIHFNNLNYVTRNMIVDSVTQSFVLPASYLPINKNVNHILTRNKRKQEFFFNKRNLLMNFKGTGVAGSDVSEYYLDNIKFYQLDMVPFFQYFISPIGVQGNINKSVQIPNNGTSPIIDFGDDNIIDSNNDNNDIITFFSNSLIAANIEIPTGINWQRDYSIYRTQLTGNDILGSSDPYNED